MLFATDLRCSNKVRSMIPNLVRILLHLCKNIIEKKLQGGKKFQKEQPQGTLERVGNTCKMISGNIKREHVHK